MVSCLFTVGDVFRKFNIRVFYIPNVSRISVLESRNPAYYGCWIIVAYISLQVPFERLRFMHELVQELLARQVTFD